MNVVQEPGRAKHKAKSVRPMCTSQPGKPHVASDVHPRPSLRGTVLVANTGDLARKVLTFTLRSQGYDATSADDLSQVLSLVSCKPNLVILEDTFCGAQPPLSVVPRIRAAALSGTTILLLADALARPDVAKLLTAGVSHIVLKRGFQMDAFLSAVAKLLPAGPARALW